MIITIDGPAGAGKSTAAKALAYRLGFQFLDTGAMYRAVALATIRGKVDFQDDKAVERLVESLHLCMEPGRLLLDGEDVTALIRSPEVTAAAGTVAQHPAVRKHLVRLQRAIADGKNMVCEGRDQGTVVFPESPCKFFLVADPLERANRRAREIAARGDKADVQAILAAQQVRDRLDAARDLAPMVPATDAVHLDSTQLTIDEVVEKMLALARECQI